MYNLSILIVFIILLLIVGYNYHYSYIQSNDLQDLLSGFWESSPEFCNEVNLDKFCIFMNENYDSYGKRGCYVLAQKDNEFLINEPCVVQIIESPGNEYTLQKPKYFTVMFLDMEDQNNEIFPPDQTMRFYPICNKIVLYSGDTITAVMYKNPHRTELNYIKHEKDSENMANSDSGDIGDSGDSGDSGGIGDSGDINIDEL